MCVCGMVLVTTSENWYSTSGINSDQTEAREQTIMSDQSTRPQRHGLDEIPPAAPHPLAARAFAQAVNDGSLLRRWNRMTRAARQANHESMMALVHAAEADGIKLSVGRISRLETRTERNEVDAIALLYILLRGGYELPDVYPPAGGTDLTEDEQILLRNYRAAPPSTRGEIVRYSGYMAHGVFAEALPGNVRELPQRERSAEDEIALDQSLHEAQTEVEAAREEIRKRRRTPETGKGTRRFYGKRG